MNLGENVKIFYKFFLGFMHNLTPFRPIDLCQLYILFYLKIIEHIQNS